MVLQSSEDDKEVFRITDWEPMEVSLVAVPADSSVGFGRDASKPTKWDVDIKRNDNFLKCNQESNDMNKKNKVPFKFTKIGSWWNRRGNELDIVAINPETKQILFAECKWQNKPVGVNTYKELREKAKLVDWFNKDRTEYFALFSKTGFTKGLEKEDVMLFGLSDMENNPPQRD